MAEPTEADRERARRLWHARGDVGGALIPAIAQALANERERTRAPFLALADDLDVDSCDPQPDDRMRLLFETAQRIRRAAEETGQ